MGIFKELNIELLNQAAAKNCDVYEYIKDFHKFSYLCSIHADFFADAATIMDEIGNVLDKKENEGGPVNFKTVRQLFDDFCNLDYSFVDPEAKSECTKNLLFMIERAESLFDVGK